MSAKMEVRSLKDGLIEHILKHESEESIMDLKLSIDNTLSMVDSSIPIEEIEKLMVFSAELSRIIHDNYIEHITKKPQSCTSEANNH